MPSAQGSKKGDWPGSVTHAKRAATSGFCAQSAKYSAGRSVALASGLTTLGLANINDDEFPDVVYAGRTDVNTQLSAVHAVDGTSGALLWTSHDVDAKVARTSIQRGAPAFSHVAAPGSTCK